MEQKPKRNVVPFKPRPHEIEKLIRELAKDSSNVKWRSKSCDMHAEAQMDWRDITDRMMFEVLRTGHLKGEVEAGKYPGEWKAKMVKQMKGNRDVGVVTIVIKSQRLFIKTVEWEDL